MFEVKFPIAILRKEYGRSGEKLADVVICFGIFIQSSMSAIVHHDGQGELLSAEQNKAENISERIWEIKQQSKKRDNASPIEKKRKGSSPGGSLAKDFEFVSAEHDREMPFRV